jgi:multiple sugar transport system permease protein
MVSPAVILLLLVGIGPLVYCLYTALHRYSPDPNVPPEFAGADNLAALVRDPEFGRSLARTALVGAIAVPLELLLGFGLALALHELGRSRGLVTTLLLIPSSLAPIIAGIVWWMLFNTRFGPVNAILGGLFGVEPIEWTVRMPWALVAIVVAVVWQWTPFVALILLGGLQTLPPSVLEAARLEGATRFQMTRRITVPLLRPFFLVAGLLMIIEIARLYEVPWYITQGGPGNETTLAGIYLFKLAFSFGGDYGRASMMSLLLVLGLSAVAAFYVRLVSERKGEASHG